MNLTKPTENVELLVTLMAILRAGQASAGNYSPPPALADEAMTLIYAAQERVSKEVEA